MSTPSVVNIDELVDGQRIGRLVIRVVILSLLVQCADGYDLATMSYAAPELIPGLASSNT